MPTANLGNMRLRHAVHTGQDAIALRACANSVNGSIGKPAVPVVKPIVMPALFSSVRVVFGMSAKAQMRRIDARRVVAFVHDDHALRDGANVKLIRVPMRAHGFFAWHQKNAVAEMIARASPFPAAIAFLKTLLKHIRWANNGKLLQSALLTQSAIASAAQFSPNNFFVAANNT